ncbi:hypothetical protein B0H66DRAFT_564612 [Apodospora peruviana]|uniref:Uncharacterized protein n=1 Tax=Apodospora peruviana TaxID=516989 RepID=A0AAE0M107_9PEZI|nr:hypothetical protein B0H66DRAFT_564612 [Apodospora peruviana]
MNAPNTAIPSETPTSQTTNDANAAFKKFDAYPWGRDRPFLQGLVAMLGPLQPGFDREKALGISLQARIWWYKSRLDVEIDRAAYEAYLAAADPSAHLCPDPSLLIKVGDIQQRMASATAAPALPSWQLQAPKVDPNKKADDGASSHDGKGGGQDAPYPDHFQAIIEAVTTGKPVPGVREIPNIVVRPAGITPVGKMQAPQKPWEKRQGVAASDATTSTSGRELLVDQEFPPVETE